MAASQPWRIRVAAAQQEGTKEMNPKIEAARAALNEVRSGMTLGLGTGTTAAEFVKLLGAALRDGTLRDIRCTCTSEQTEQQAREENIPTFALAEVSPLDLAIDGADEIDAQLRLIKGRGGALLREKIVEQQAKRFIVIADESKIVERLGTGTLPIEVTPFSLDVITKRFEELGLQPSLRMRDGTPRITDEGHRILDVHVPASEDIAETVARIRELAGVVETGFFPTEATEAIIAGPSGVRWRHRVSAGA
jgi:ribose 5-phosphate isomerase A